MPSSFSSTAQAPSLSDRLGHRRRRCAPASAAPGGRRSAGSASSAAGPSASRASATGRREPASITARRTSAAGAPSPGEPLHGDRVQRALPHLAGDQPEQEPLLLLRWPRPATRPPAGARSACEPAPATLPSSVSSGVHLAHGQGRFGGRGDRAAQHLPADAEPSLRQPPRQIRDHDRHVLRLGVPEQLGEQRDLPGPRRGGGDLLGHMGQPGKQHAAMVRRTLLAHTPTEGASFVCGCVVAGRAHAAEPHIDVPRAPQGVASRSAISSSPLIVAARPVSGLAAFTTCSAKPAALPAAYTPGTVVWPRSRRPRVRAEGRLAQLGAQPLQQVVVRDRTRRDEQDHRSCVLPSASRTPVSRSSSTTSPATSPGTTATPAAASLRSPRPTARTRRRVQEQRHVVAPLAPHQRLVHAPSAPVAEHADRPGRAPPSRGSTGSAARRGPSARRSPGTSGSSSTSPVVTSSRRARARRAVRERHARSRVAGRAATARSRTSSPPYPATSARPTASSSAGGMPSRVR